MRNRTPSQPGPSLIEKRLSRYVISPAPIDTLAFQRGSCVTRELVPDSRRSSPCRYPRPSTRSLSAGGSPIGKAGTEKKLCCEKPGRESRVPIAALGTCDCRRRIATSRQRLMAGFWRRTPSAGGVTRGQAPLASLLHPRCNFDQHTCANEIGVDGRGRARRPALLINANPKWPGYIALPRITRSAIPILC